MKTGLIDLAIFGAAAMAFAAMQGYMLGRNTSIYFFAMALIAAFAAVSVLHAISNRSSNGLKANSIHEPNHHSRH